MKEFNKNKRSKKNMLDCAFLRQDMVNNPPHYTNGGLECIDAMISSQGTEAVKNFCLCNAFKYIWRTKNKNGIEDIDKAIWYLNKYKELTNKNS
jgi:hypothetical protein